MKRLNRFFSVSGFFQGFFLYSEPILALPVLLVPTLAGVPLEGTSVFVGISLMGWLSLNGVSLTNSGFTAVTNYLTVIRRVEAMLQLPEIDSKGSPEPENTENTIEASEVTAAWSSVNRQPLEPGSEDSCSSLLQK